MLNPARRSGEVENEARSKAAHHGRHRRHRQQSRLRPDPRKVHDRRQHRGIREIAELGNQELHRHPRLRHRHRRTSTKWTKIAACFEADWHRKEFTPPEHSNLIWCSSNGRDRIAQFIDDAKHTLFLQNERYQDPIIIERLVRAKGRGVKVHVMARPPHTLKKEKLIEGVGGLRIMDDVGIKIHKLKHLKLHAQNAARRRLPGDCRLHQSHAGQLRQPARTGD